MLLMETIPVMISETDAVKRRLAAPGPCRRTLR